MFSQFIHFICHFVPNLRVLLGLWKFLWQILGASPRTSMNLHIHVWSKVFYDTSIKYNSDISKQVFSQSKFLLNGAKESYFVNKVNEYSFLEQTWCLDCVNHMSVSESVSHKDKVSSKNNIYRKKAINIHMVHYFYFL